MKTAEEFDQAFDDNADIDALVEQAEARRPNIEQQTVQQELPIWMIQKLDAEAQRLGIARQAMVKVFLAERLAHIQE